MIGAPVAYGAADHLKRSIGTFQLTMFGVGSTVGTGIFFVLSQAVPEAGPSVIVSFIIAGIAAGLAAICYAELASAVPVSGSSYSYAYATLGEAVAMGVAACLLLEYGVSTAAVAVGWSGYVNKLLNNLFGFQMPHALSAAPWDAEPGYVNLPAVILIGLCALLLIRGASESAMVNAIMVLIKLGVLGMFVIIAFTAYDADHLKDFAPFGVAGIGSAAGTIFFSFIGLDAVSTAGDEVKDPQKTMPRALIAALVIVTGVYVLVALAALGTQPWQNFGEQQEAGLATILDNVTHGMWASTILAAGAVISIFTRHAGHPVRPDPHPVRDGSRRAAAVAVREGESAHDDPGDQHGDRRDRHVAPGRLHTPRQAGGHGVHRHAHRVHRRVRSG